MNRRYLNLGNTAIRLDCPDQEFAETADRHLFLSSSFEGPVLATIRYITDDSIENLMPFAGKNNVVHIDRKEITKDHERIVLGMLNTFTAVLDIRNERTDIRFGSQAPVQALLDDVLQAALQPVLGNMGGFILHGACMVRDRRAIVLMGNSGSGKSTTAFNLTRFNFRSYADDAVLVTPGDKNLLVWPLARELSLRPLSFRLFEAQKIKLDPYEKVGDKYYFSQSAPKPGGALLEHICFLNLSGEAKTHLIHLDHRHTLKILDANNRHFSFLGRNHAHRYARILTHRVPAPLQADLGTDLEYQGMLFDKLLSGRKRAFSRNIQPKAYVPTRSKKSALIRQAWSSPNQEHLSELIPLLGDFDPKIFKLALGFFQTYPLAGILPLVPAAGRKTDHPKDPAPWLKAEHWQAGCRTLLRQCGVEIVQKFAYSWLKSAPLLYPFFKALLAENDPRMAPLDSAWERFLQQHSKAEWNKTIHIHLLNFQNLSAWAAAESDAWWRNPFFNGRQPIQLYFWIAEGIPTDWRPIMARLSRLSTESCFVIVPMVHGRSDIESSLALVRTALSHGIRTKICRQTPLCRIPQTQALFLLEAGAFETSGVQPAIDERFYCRPGNKTTGYTKASESQIPWPPAHARFEARPYPDCDTCRLFDLALCRGGIMQHSKIKV